MSAQSTAVIRPVCEADFEDIHALALTSGGGMTNLPADADTLQGRIAITTASFAADARATGSEFYMLGLDVDGVVMGTGGLFSAVGDHEGFVNYKIHRVVQASTLLGKSLERRVLTPTHDFTGASEVASLYLSPDARGGGYGKLLARARYLFIAQRPEIFAEDICGELRGWRAPDGRQPFWEALGKRFFDLDFEEADALNSAHGNGFIADLLPAFPIYVSLLPDDAQACLAKPHESAEPAYRMLLAEGFSFNDYIDVFDGGPLVNTKTREIKTLAQSATATLNGVAAEGDQVLQSAKDAIIAVGAVANFRAARGGVAFDDNGEAIVSSQTARMLNIEKGEQIRWVDW